MMKKLLAKARTLYKKGRYQDSLVIAKKVLMLDERNDEALFYVAHGLYYAGQFRRSLQFWKRLEKVCPTEPSLYLNMGACYEDLGEIRQAIKNYKKELELYPVSITALYNLGALYFHSRKYKLAANYLERSYSQKNSVKACVCRLAHSYFKTGQSEKEQILYEEFLQTNPNDTWALNNLGSHLMDQGQYNRALLRLKKAARIDPADKLVAKNIQKIERILQRQTPS
jgi:tetratricopeptide (TPR) repeat protein